MALVSKKDFGEALKISYGTIRSKVSRKQLCCNRKGFIDTEHPLNFMYLVEVNGGNQIVFDNYDINRTNVNKKSSPQSKKQENVLNIKQNVSSVAKVDVKSKVDKTVNPSKIKASVNVAPTVDKKTAPVVQKEKSLSAEEKKELQEQKKQRNSLLDFELRKKEADTRLSERKAELSQMELEKKAGNTLPLDLMQKIVVINFQSVLNSFLLESKNLATVMVERFGGTRSDTVEIETKINHIFKKVVDTTKKNVAKEIESAVSEYSEVRSRGEKK